VSPSYCTTWPYLVLATWPSLVLARFKFLLDHVSGPLLFHMSVFYWHTCHVAVGSRVTSLLDHMSYFDWSTWLFLIRPHVMALSVYVSYFYSATWFDDFLPCVRFLIDHVSCLPISRVMHWFIHVSHFYLIMWPVLVLPHGVQSIHHRSNSRSSLPHILTT
jgi:hypothetical protein